MALNITAFPQLVTSGSNVNPTALECNCTTAGAGLFDDGMTTPPEPDPMSEPDIASV